MGEKVHNGSRTTVDVPQVTSSQREVFARDMPPSPFQPILAGLVERTPGGVGAVFVDMEGETVDYHAPQMGSYDIKVMAAEWQVFARQLVSMKGLALATKPWVVIRSVRRSYIVRPLPQDYALILALSRGAGFASLTHSLAVAERHLFAEASWHWDRANWYLVEVESDLLGKPKRIRTARAFTELTVMGTLSQTRARERGYRVQLDTGRELTLMREWPGYWYTDELLVSYESHARDNSQNSRQGLPGKLLNHALLGPAPSGSTNSA